MYHSITIPSAGRAAAYPAVAVARVLLLRSALPAHAAAGVAVPGAITSPTAPMRSSAAPGSSNVTAAPATPAQPAALTLAGLLLALGSHLVAAGSPARHVRGRHQAA